MVSLVGSPPFIVFLNSNCMKVKEDSAFIIPKIFILKV